MAERFNQIVILTGAGISAESGLDTFRDHGGLWSGYEIEDVATPDAFRHDPDLVHDFYNMRRRAALNAEPNNAHYALARLEKQFPGSVTIITQNVDDLHERAGNKNVIHMHGELRKTRCIACDVIHETSTDIQTDTHCPACKRRGYLRPHIVWFGEMPLELETIYAHLDACDLFLSIGTSGTVYPAAGFVDYAGQSKKATVEINLEPSARESKFERKIYGKACVTVPAFVDDLLAIRC